MSQTLNMEKIYDLRKYIQIYTHIQYNLYNFLILFDYTFI